MENYPNFIHIILYNIEVPTMFIYYNTYVKIMVKFINKERI